MFKILLVDDDRDFSKAVIAYLGRSGYEMDYASTADEAYDKIYAQVYDLILSDIMMPGTDGFQFASHIRAINRNIPLLFISALDDISSKHKGFQLGIDDYMVKPIELDELLMRIKAILRRSGIAQSKRLVIGDTVLDREERSAYVSGVEIYLTQREFDIVFKLLSYPKKIFSRQALMDEFWDSETTSSTRTVDVYVTKLRDKFSSSKDFEIQTVHGLGYKAVIL
ncbi:MAG: response regulator transcription factor [Candidatus Ornithospirochaeta sp.]|nr:response regulator transcription factor [Sphaerochaetaceae bacterium]MDD7161830.1 response regulator transcription factor [Sphaerochaetaceae bacterium]MDY5522819.1 response regulator transcription factor [Candidatus Ornithospirochaeta sp.]